LDSASRSEYEGCCYVIVFVDDEDRELMAPEPERHSHLPDDCRPEWGPAIGECRGSAKPPVDGRRGERDHLRFPRGIGDGEALRAEVQRGVVLKQVQQQREDA
jgi:hypothetical protein